MINFITNGIDSQVFKKVLFTVTNDNSDKIMRVKSTDFSN